MPEEQTATVNYIVGDSIMFSGEEKLLHFDHATGNLINVYFNHGQAGDTRFCGIIVDIKEHKDFGGELEIYSEGEILTLPWHPGQKPKLFIIGENRKYDYQKLSEI